ncbi:MAG: type II toxin-antitoxin system death-on-curing family toxin [Solidesulfovibrio sp. DCME]|uniref:type II toxin-antitoxin system death-on-curing family toxin n=1 Tax=Solidesulfovibrio sp. DCME TaxID=3447380 RepID=UPI003D0E3B2E
MNWTWIEVPVVLAIHDRQIEEHGGLAGTRDLALLEGALARPRQWAAHAAPDGFDLAALYAHGIARSHPFLDGNKRTAYVTAMLFLRLHGLGLTAPGTQRVLVFEALGKGTLTAEALADWLHNHRA